MYYKFLYTLVVFLADGKNEWMNEHAWYVAQKGYEDQRQN